MKKNVTLNIGKGLLHKATLFILVLLTMVSTSFAQLLINESFSTITAANPLPAGWAQQNRTVPPGTAGWFQGNPAAFPAFNGAPNAYIAANFNSAGPVAATISNWLFTPTINVKNGDQLTFYTRTVSPAQFPDRLQVRLSTSGTSTNVGTTNVSTGDFATLLLDINPTLTTTGYPTAWTQFTVTVSGVAAPTQGRIAFRYFVTDGGFGNNSEYIGLDQVVYDGTPCTNTPAAAPIITTSSFSVCAGSPVTLTANGPLNNSANYAFYTGACGTGTLLGTGNSITVSPAVTTTYFVRGQGGCGTTPNGECGQITITVVNCTCVSPGAATICEGTVQRLAVTVPTLATQTFSSADVVLIPGTGTSGIAAPYPSAITVAGVPAGYRVKSITINGITHTWMNDVDIAVVSPTAVPVVIMSDVGGGATGTAVRTYTFDDAAATTLPDAATPSGTFRPSNIGATDNYVAPGPGSLTQATPTLASFGTGNLNGTWNLYGVDDVGGDIGRFNSWSITFIEPLPTAIFTGGTFFTDAAGTIPYVAGTETNEVYVRPTATTTYTATIAAGPCAGANNVTVTVLPRPVITVTPLSGCAPVTITASGATIYNWTPTAGLTPTTGPVVSANPATTTTYSVTGVNPNGCSSIPVNVTVNAAPTASVIAPAAPIGVFQINEDFAVVPPAGWTQQNLSTAPFLTSWFQGNTAVFPSFDGAPTAYAAANFNNTAPGGTISSWLFTPTVNIKNGDIVSFYTRAAASFANRAERLQLRMSLNGGSTNVGATSTSVGDFTTTLVEVNPNLLPGSANYPEVWTRYQAIITGVTGTVSGKFALRYFVTNGGNVPGINSNFIGVDRFQYGAAPSNVNCANVVTNIAVDITGGVGPYTVVYSNGTTSTTINGYTSGSNIQVSPGATTTYTIVSVTGSNGCVGTGNSGSALITITPPASITTQPVTSNTCIGNNATFTVVSAPSTGNVIQWQVSTDSGRTYTNITNAPPYSGATTGTLTVTGVTAAQNGLRFRAIIQGACGPAVITNGVFLNANAPAVITTQPALTTTVCGNGSANSSATVRVVATGTALTYQYQVSTDGGLTYTNVANGGNYAGVTTNTLTLSNIPTSFSGYLYRVLVTSGGCTATRSDSTRLIVNAAPVIVTTANPSVTIIPGQTTTLSVAVSPNAGATYQWFLNGVLIPGATSSTYVVGIDGFGDYTVTVTDINGCRSTSAAFTISAGTSENIFIYPSPNTGQFQIRFSDPNGFNSNLSRIVSIYDSKGSRVYTRTYAINQPFERLDVDLRQHGKGVYTVDLTDRQGRRLKTGRVVIF